MAATMMKREQLTNAERDMQAVSLAFYSGMMMGALGLAIAVLLVLIATGTHVARAHDLWINGKRNGAGEWCCGASDCAVMDPDTVGFTSRGYEIDGTGTISGTGQREHYREIVPAVEAMPSPDGAYWRCKRPDGSRRCFFAPPPNT